MPKKVKIEYTDGSSQEIDYPTPEEIERINREAKAIVAKLMEDLETDFGKEPRN